MFQKQNEPGEHCCINIGRSYLIFLITDQLEVATQELNILEVTILEVTILEVTTQEDPPDILKESHLQQLMVCQLALLLCTTWSRGARATMRRWEASVKPV